MLPVGPNRTDAEPPPKAVGGVHLLRRIGDGAMSDVFLGFDSIRGEHVAVKLLARHLAADPHAVRRFTREARLSRSLVHASLVRGLGGGLDAGTGRHYLVMEYVDGPSALSWLSRGGPLPLPRVARLSADVGAALRHLHGRSLIHRDVKPDNILLAPTGSAKLADLGLVRRMRAGLEAGEATPAAAGTPHYMPPEQVVDPDKADPRSDLYALGATIYHLLTGEVPFDGDSQDELLRQKLGSIYRPATALRPDLPGGVDVLLGRLLVADPGERYQTAGEFLTAVRQHLGRPAPLTEPTPEVDAADMSPPLEDDSDQARTHVDIPVLPPRTHGKPAAGLLVLATVVVAGLAAKWSTTPDAPPNSAAGNDIEAVQTQPATAEPSARPVDAQ